MEPLGLFGAEITDGAGDGFSAALLSMAPANFQRQQPTLVQVIGGVITLGSVAAILQRR